MLALSLILAGILMRFAPHAPNFTPVAAIALFSGARLNKKYAFLVPLALMIASDLVIGLHEVVLFTWGGFILVTLLGRVMQQKVSTARVISFSLISSLLFYLVSNFGVWFMGWYSRDLKGLVDCYIMGLPFLRNFTIATLSYAAILFGIYQIIAHYVKDTELAKVLLTK